MTNRCISSLRKSRPPEGEGTEYRPDPECVDRVVNEPGGTGSKSRLKTGPLWQAKRAQPSGRVGQEKPSRRGRTAPDLNDHAWFVALASADKPEIAVAVLVENGGHGGSAARLWPKRCSTPSTPNEDFTTETQRIQRMLRLKIFRQSTNAL